MKQEYKEILRAIANDEPIQYLYNKDHWVDVTPIKVFTLFSSGCPNQQFRVKPKEIVVNDIICEAPSDGKYRLTIIGNDLTIEPTILCFPTAEAREAMYAALIKPFVKDKSK